MDSHQGETVLELHEYCVMAKLAFVCCKHMRVIVKHLDGEGFLIMNPLGIVFLVMLGIAAIGFLILLLDEGLTWKRK
jgi:hypothetical protein